MNNSIVKNGMFEHYCYFYVKLFEQPVRKYIKTSTYTCINKN